MKALVVLATKHPFDYYRLEAQFKMSEFQVAVVHNLNDLYVELRKAPFAIFLDNDFDPEMINFPHIYHRDGMYWVMCMRGKINKALSMKALASGFELTIEDPKEAEQYILRSRQLQQIKNLPEGVVKVEAAQSKELTPIQTVTPVEDLPHQVLKVKRPFTDRRPQWKDYVSGAQFQGVFEGLESLRGEFIRLFERLLEETKSDVAQLSLFTVRADTPIEKSAPKIRLLIENHWQSFSEYSMRLDEYPDLELMFSKDQALFLPSTTLIGKSPVVAEKDFIVASIPIRSDKNQQAVGALRAQIPQTKGFNFVEYLEDLTDFSKKLGTGFSTLEFFSRVYAADSKLYQDEF